MTVKVSEPVFESLSDGAVMAIRATLRIHSLEQEPAGAKPAGS